MCLRATLSAGSALGQSRPRQLIIAAVMFEGRANAVLELGFFNPVKDTDRELVARVQVSIGVAVRSAAYRTRLQELLEETQRQAEELQAQSEELRVSNEELEEQGRALKESQARLEQQQAELEQTNAQLEEQTQILETQKDDLTRTKGILEDPGARAGAGEPLQVGLPRQHVARTCAPPSIRRSSSPSSWRTTRGGNLAAEQVKYAETIRSAGNDLLGADQ